MNHSPRPTLERALIEAAVRCNVLPAVLRMDSRTLLGQDEIKAARERALMAVHDLGIWSGPEIAAALGRAPSSISTAVRRARLRNRAGRAMERANMRTHGRAPAQRGTRGAGR